MMPGSPEANPPPASEPVPAAPEPNSAEAVAPAVETAEAKHETPSDPPVEPVEPAGASAAAPAASGTEPDQAPVEPAAAPAESVAESKPEESEKPVSEQETDKQAEPETGVDKANADEPAAGGETQVEATKRSLEIHDEDVLESVREFKRRLLGTVVYEPRKLLFKDYDDYLNSVVKVRVARRYITPNHEPYQRRAVWGTSVYTDDSDIVASLFHEGYLQDTEPLFTAGSDLLVSVLILPPLKKYTGSTRHGLNSRTWITPHDGTSYKILAVDEISRGSAESPLGRRRERAQMWSEAYNLARPASGQMNPHPAETAEP